MPASISLPVCAAEPQQRETVPSKRRLAQAGALPGATLHKKTKLTEACQPRQAQGMETPSRLQTHNSAAPADQSASFGGAGSDDTSDGDADSSGDSAGQAGQEKIGTPFSRAFATIMAQDADILEVTAAFRACVRDPPVHRPHQSLLWWAPACLVLNIEAGCCRGSTSSLFPACTEAVHSR